MSNFRFFSVLISLSLLTLTAKAQDPTYLYHDCPNTTTFSPNSTFQFNLNSLFSALSSNASTSNVFYNASSGQNPNLVNGLFLCRADVSAATCQNCVNFATTHVVQRCPIEKEVVIWYDECLLRYSNKTIFSIMATRPSIILMNTQNATDQTRFSEIVGTTVNKTATDAAPTARRFAAEKANVSSFQSLYSLVQCTPDLSSSNCNMCLTEIISSLQIRQLGGRVIAPSCSVRFELYPFYNESAVAALAPPPPPPVVAPPPDIAINPPKGKGQKSRGIIIIIAIVVPVGVFLTMLFVVGCCWITRRGKKMRKNNLTLQEDNAGSDMTTIEYDLNTIEVATDKFAARNKLGEGGFGAVYKGRLDNGQEIAVKRLSMSSRQGDQEFKNEVQLVARLQHRNLVRLHGFCLEGKEMLLIYEFMPNSSLDRFLFDPTKRIQLDWRTRYKIIGGIARGLLYLHEDSRLRIIHHDLKASNILLDIDMNPKISDFGLARMFLVDQTQDEASRVCGTYGYMAPEYITKGHVSVKIDVYSFGVMVLEIVSSQKISSLRQGDEEDAVDLLSYAWRNWREGTPLDIVDPNLSKGSNDVEAIRCINIGLLCVQENVARRPTMGSVVAMLQCLLATRSMTPPTPSRPAFFMGSTTQSDLSSPQEFKSEAGLLKSTNEWASINEVSITELDPR